MGSVRDDGTRTITKKELIDRISEATQQRRSSVKKILQMFLDEVIEELAEGNRLEFRDFGVFECKTRKARRAQNPKTLAPVKVPEKRTVKFKVGRLMKQKLEAHDTPPSPTSAAARGTGASPTNGLHTGDGFGSPVRSPHAE